MGQLQSKINGCIHEGTVLAEKYAFEYGFEKMMLMMMMIMNEMLNLFLCQFKTEIILRSLLKIL